jgi:aryl carrier-like protein
MAVTMSRRDGREERLLNSLVALWTETLGRECDEHSDLFELGGDSLTIMRMIGRIGELGGGPVSFGAVLDAPTPRELAAWLTAREPNRGEPA